MPRLFPASCLFSVLSGVVVIGLLFGKISLAQESEESLKEETFDRIEDRFFQVQDASGYFWQTTTNGALTSGETRYLQAGLNLLVDGKAFAPTEGSMVPPSDASLEAGAISLTLLENRENLRLRRSLAFDLGRGGVQVLDELTNTSSASVSVKVDLRTTYPFAWQSLHNQLGEPLSSEPTLQLRGEDQGVLVHFSPIEGQHDTFILTGAGDGALFPRLKASNNRRELTLGYEIALAPGESASLLHWMLQLGLQKVENVEEGVRKLIRNRELIAPRIDRAMIPSVINFREDSFPKPQGSFRSLRQLVSLNDVLERLGAQRRSKPVLWIDSSTQLAGDISGSEVISINDSYRGPQSIPIADIAAILDRGLNGKGFQVFLRDGRVLVGEIEELGLAFKADDSETAKSLTPGSFRALLFSVSERDGVSSDDVVGNLEVVDGSVLSLEKKDQVQFEFATSWGKETLPAEQVQEMKFIAEPVPHFRCVAKSGDRFPGFLSGATLKLSSAGDSPIEVPVALISRYGTNGMREETIGQGADSWIDFDEIPSSWIPDDGFLLESGELRAGGFADELLDWKQGDQVVEVATKEIKRLRRETSQSSIVFSLVLKSGETLSGLPAEPVVSVTIGGETHPLPVEKLYAFRRTSS